MIYSDAEFDPEAQRLPKIGWVVIQPSGQRRGYSMVVPQEVVAALMPRKQQIFAAEAFAVLAALSPRRAGLARKGLAMVR